MAVRVGILSAAHMHVYSYAWCLSNIPEAELVGVYDTDETRGKGFALQVGTNFYGSCTELLDRCDAVVVASENALHRPNIEKAAHAGKHILCEKPIATKEADAQAIIHAAAEANVKLMTAFPCPFSPAFVRLKQRVAQGDIGDIVSICATNRGKCPFDWFVNPALSGGGAMIDHTVHVADLLHRLIGEEPHTVMAQTGNNLYDQTWEDTAMLTLSYAKAFATIDSSWSRPSNYKTWGDVTLNVVGEKGLIELDMFNQQFDYYSSEKNHHETIGFASNIDLLMVQEFIRAIQEDRPPVVTGEDGLFALRVALAGYESQKAGQPVSLAPEASSSTSR